MKMIHKDPKLSDLTRLNESHVKQVAKLFAQTFQDDPLITYFIPDASVRRSKAHFLFELVTRHSIRFGEVYAISPNLEGVAAWLPSERVHMTLWGEIRNGALSMLFKVGIRFVLRVMSANDYLFSMHKNHTPFRHWQLLLLAVDPMFQGKGYANILLRAMFDRLEKEHLPCYVDIQNGKNVSLYKHYGFRVVEESIISGTDIRTWALLREESNLSGAD